MPDVVIILTGGSTWTVPVDWDSSANTIEAIGGGGQGSQGINSIGGSTDGGGGGGGGAYTKLTNFTAAPGAVISIHIGVGGNGGVDGEDTTFDTTTVVAKGGATALLSATHGTGGDGASCTPAIGARSGGDGGDGAAAGVSDGGGGGGGGGAGGLNGVGSNGTNGSTTVGGAGGAGDAGSGGAGGSGSSGNGGNGTEWTTAGSGGGGGGGNAGTAAGSHNGVNAGTSGTYGAGGGGGGGVSQIGATPGAGQNGRNGVIVITYTPKLFGHGMVHIGGQTARAYVRNPRLLAGSIHILGQSASAHQSFGTGHIHIVGQAATVALVQRYLRFTWDASVTPLATYHMYYGGGATNKQIDVGTPDYSLPAGTTTFDVPIQDLGGLYPGTLYFMLRAVDPTATYEERNVVTVFVELDDLGFVLEPQPNVPTIILNSIEFSGRQVTARVVYNSADEVGIGTTAQLFARNPGGTYSLAAPIATGALVTTDRNLKSATLTYTFLSDQVVYLAACVVSDLGRQSDQSNEVGPYNPSTALMPAPTDFSVSVSRG